MSAVGLQREDAGADAGLPALAAAEREALDAQVYEFVAALRRDPGSEARDALLARVQGMGGRDAEAAARASARVLALTARAGGAGTQVQVGAALDALRRAVEALDPARAGDLAAPRRLLGFIPAGDGYAAYFARYRGAQAELDALLQQLVQARDALLRDSARIVEEAASLRAAADRLHKYAYLGRCIDRELERDASLATSLRDDVLYAVRQRTTDLLAQAAVAQQGRLTLELVQKNNAALIDAIDRTTRTTVAALRTAVAAALALADQRLVLDRIQALNDAATATITARAFGVHSDAATLASDASRAAQDLARLSAAFQDVYQAMDHLEAERRDTRAALDASLTDLDAATQRTGGTP